MSPLPPPLNRTIQAKWIIKNKQAPDWSEEGECLIFWCEDEGLNRWIRRDTGTVLGQTPGDHLEVIEWDEAPVPVTRALAMAEGRLDSGLDI